MHMHSSQDAFNPTRFICEHDLDPKTLLPCPACKRAFVVKEGFKLHEVFELEGIPNRVNSAPLLMTYANKAPHPNAAKLFSEFIFAKESQQLLADREGLYTGHPEVTYPADKPKLKELKLLSADPDELEKRNAELKKRFVEFFGA